MLNESEIINGCKQNSAAHQRLLYNRYAPFLKSVCIRYVKDPDEAKDLLQDGFIKIFNSLGKYTGEGAFEGWMRRIVINVALDHLKKAKKLQTNQIEDWESNEKPDHEPHLSNAELLLNAGFSAEDLMVILHRIPSEYATVFNMFHIDNMAHKEIGDALAINESTSRKRLYIARNLLRKELEKELAKRQRINP